MELVVTNPVERPDVERVVKIKAALLKGVRKFLDARNYIEIETPHITKVTGSCENMDTLFELDYFGERAFLCQTGQLYLESLIPKVGNVFCIGPSFRAEPDVDARHKTEFTLIEIEGPYDFNYLLKEIELMFLYMAKEVGMNIKIPFKKVTYTQAVEDLKKNFDSNIKWGDDLKSKHEKFLCEFYGNKPFFITHFPRAIKFFNMKVNKEDSRIVNSADLILPHSGEAVGAAEREYEYNALIERLQESMMFEQLKAKGGTIEDFKWYFEHVKKGSVPHAGCGIGIDRVAQWIMKTNNISDCAIFTLNRATLY